jgi:1D-myo-inositol 3-kinase
VSLPHSPAYDYVTIGHVTVDVLADGSRQPGGGAFYSALQAARLGLRTLVVTRGEPTELQALLAPYSAELELQIEPSEHTTTLLTTGSGAERSQRVLSWAGPIAADIELDSKIVHLAPVARETPADWRGHAGFVGITPQGLVRDWDADGVIALVELAPSSLPARFDAAVISQVELRHCETLLRRVTDPSQPLVAVTAGAEEITIYSAAGAAPQPPALAISRPRDDLGAGDVFAAAMFVALAEGATATAAVAFGSGAAAVRLGGVGPQAVGDRGALERATQS